MNHTAQNSLKASAYLLGISVEELIDVLHNASKIKEIRTTSGYPFVLPSREGEKKPAPEVHKSDNKGCGTDSEGFTQPNYADADECKRAITRLTHGVRYWQIEADYWFGMWLNEIKR